MQRVYLSLSIYIYIYIHIDSILIDSTRGSIIYSTPSTRSMLPRDPFKMIILIDMYTYISISILVDSLR